MTGEKKEEKGICEYIMHDNRPCGRPLYDDEHCIFHSKDIQGKKREFYDLFWKEFERQKEQEEKYDFRGFVFPGYINFEERRFEKDVSFEGAQFSAKANFGGAQFSGKAIFVLAHFSGEAYFRFAQFSGGAYFVITQFSGQAVFMETQFSGVAHFETAKFSGVADFKEAQFSGKAIFSLAQFSGQALFMEVRFSGRATFVDAQFSGESDLTKAEFKEVAYFNNIKIEKDNMFKMHDTYFYNVSGLFEYIEANKKKFKYSNKTEFLPDKFRLILGEEATARYPIISRKIRDDMYLLKFKEKHPWWFKVWWLFADCGRSMLRWALWALIFAEVFAIIFGLSYYFNPASFKSEVISFSWPGVSFLYYSIVTFTTLGFGDIVPKIPGLQIIIIIEVILGYIMLGLLIGVGAQRIGRRS